MFEIKKRDGLARIGEFTTKHGKVRTPALLPVINPNMSQLFPTEMKKKFKAQMVITNSYIIKKSGRLREVALEQGVHQLLKTDMPIMTDSGTFQTYVYGDLQIDHREIVEFQRDIGSDVGTMLDVFTKPDEGYTKAKNDIRENLKRGEESHPLKGDMLLAGTVQGGIFPELRRWCAEEMSRLGFDFYPLGGVVPLMEGYRYNALADVILSAKLGLDPSRPAHLFGGGHPMVFAFAALAGIDFFDSSSYIKYAKDDRMMFTDSSRRLSTIHELACACPVCSSYTAGELQKLEKEERIRKLAEHNLYVMFQEMRTVRDAIAGEYLHELVEQRCRSHPSLVAVLDTFARHNKELEKRVSISRRTAFFDISPFSLRRPIISRLHSRLDERWYPFAPFYVELDDMSATVRKPYTIGFSGFIHKYLKERPGDERSSYPLLGMVKTKMGLVPLELGEMYPVAQSVMNSVHYPEECFPFSGEHMKFCEKKGVTFIEVGKKAPKDIMGKLKRTWDRKLKESSTLSFREFRDIVSDFRSLRLKGSRTPFFDLLMLVSVLDYQFGAGAFEAIFLDRKTEEPLPSYLFQRFTTEEIEDAGIEFVKSKNTGKIRNILGNGKHLLSMHAHDGFFILKTTAGSRFSEHTGRYQVTVESETAQFNRKGKSVFAKFVLDADCNIRPGDEVVVVDEGKRPVAVGSALLTTDEMEAFKTGIAVKVSEGMEKKI